MCISNAWIGVFSFACMPSQFTIDEIFNNWSATSCQVLSAHHLPPWMGGLLTSEVLLTSPQTFILPPAFMDNSWYQLLQVEFSRK